MLEPLHFSSTPSANLRSLIFSDKTTSLLFFLHLPLLKNPHHHPSPQEFLEDIKLKVTEPPPLPKIVELVSKKISKKPPFLPFRMPIGG
jgi:hypothetical protein